MSRTRQAPATVSAHIREPLPPGSHPARRSIRQRRGALAVTARDRWKATATLPRSSAFWRSGVVKGAARLAEMSRRSGRGRPASPICTAHLAGNRPRYRDKDGAPMLIEATCNQVNQDRRLHRHDARGFPRLRRRLADVPGVDPATGSCSAAITSGRTPGRHEPAARRWPRRTRWCAAYVEAGFTQDPPRRQHGLRGRRRPGRDASSPPAPPISPRWPRQRAVAPHRTTSSAPRCRCRAARPKRWAILRSPRPRPRGAPWTCIARRFSRGLSHARTGHRHRRAAGRRLRQRPDFCLPTPAAQRLSAAPPGLGGRFEAHSTDYQEQGALPDLVAAHFAILKVGPRTSPFARRCAMAAIEDWLGVETIGGHSQGHRSADGRGPRMGEYVAEAGNGRGWSEFSGSATASATTGRTPPPRPPPRG